MLRYKLDIFIVVLACIATIKQGYYACMFYLWSVNSVSLINKTIQFILSGIILFGRDFDSF